MSSRSVSTEWLLKKKKRMAIVYKKTWDGTVHYLSWYEPYEWNGLIDNAFEFPLIEAMRVAEEVRFKYKYDEVNFTLDKEINGLSNSDVS